MWKKGIQVVADYIQRFASELSDLTFDPEKAFETLVEYPDGSGGALISGAIDIVRHDNPPRVSLIDFKSGDPDSDKHMKLDEEEMKLQVAIYALAAKKELEYEPEAGLVRYLDSSDRSKSELRVPLDAGSLAAAQSTVAKTAHEIKNRKFNLGPKSEENGNKRCSQCDFTGICGQKEAIDYKKGRPTI